LDDLKISQLSEEDKKFIEEFTNMELLAMNNTGIKTLVNMPDAPKLQRVRTINAYSNICRSRWLIIS
jgi:hypothetical protein